MEQNRFFAENLKEYGDELGLECEIVTSEDIDVYEPADVVISRIRDPNLSSSLEDNGATVFNRSSVSRICNDKAYTYAFVKSLGIPFLPFSTPGSDLPKGPPWVVKSRDGHGGSEVFKAENKQDVDRYVSRIGSDRAIIQQFCTDPGKDMRVYVLGGRIIASVLRSSEVDFRANFKLGGKAELVEPSEDVQKMVRKISSELMADFIGVDFIFNDGEPYLNEIEDAVGTRMIYSLTDLDPAKMYMQYIARCLNL